MELQKIHPDSYIPFLLQILLLPILRMNCDVILNEVQTISNQGNNKEFIELYNPDPHPVQLDNYTVVLYSGESNQAYAVLSLQHGLVAPLSYYVIGSSIVSPQPDRLLDEKSNVNILSNGLNAVALYHGNRTMFVYGMQLTNTSLTDALVYGENSQPSSELLSILTPGEHPVQRSRQDNAQESVNRCNGYEALKLSQWILNRSTPGTSNNCMPISSPEFPPLNPGDLPPPIGHATNLPPYDRANLLPFILINEFDIGAQYIELYDGGIGGISLDGLIIVFYSGASASVYANPITLDGYTTDDNGYFLVAPNNFYPIPDIQLSSIMFNEGVNAIALHFGVADAIVLGYPVTSQSLVDVVVYGDTPDPEDNLLVTILSEGHFPLMEEDDSTHQVRSLSRCRGWARYMPQSFTTTSTSPKADNVCDFPAIVINEINVAAEGDSLNEFIELYDGGLGHQSLDGLVIALYNGKTSAVYRSYDMTGFTTNTKGFAVIGFVNHTYVNVPIPIDPDTGFIQPGLDAIGLHLGPIQRFQRSTPMSTYNLVDAIVYGTNDNTDLDFLHAILPLQDIPNEITGYGDIDHSISRCTCCTPLDSSTFGVAPVSPGQINIGCVRNGETVTETLDHYVGIVRINEVHMSDSSGGGSMQGEYIEVYDSGFGGIPLDNITVVVYNGNADERSSWIWSLNGYHTDSQGYFVIGTAQVTPTPQIVSDRTILVPSRLSGAVAIYKVATQHLMTFTATAPASRQGLIDAMVYGTLDDFDLELLEALAPGQSHVNTHNLTATSSILRCFSHQASDQLAFIIGQSSPGADNLCPLPCVVINEVNVVSMGEDVGEFVELSSNGVPYFPLNNLYLIFWRGRAEVAYKVVAIDGHKTDSNGFFLIGYQGLVSPRPDLTPFPRMQNYIKDASNLISIHVGKPGEFYKNMPATNAGLVAAMAHVNSGDQRGYPDSILEILIPGQTPGSEPIYSSASNRDESINRCEAPSGGVSWQTAHISPKSHNHCRIRTDAELVINEVSLGSSEQFVELWDKGAGFTNLDDFVVILYGKDGISYWTIPLSGYMTDAMGYFIIGVASTIPHAQFIFADGFMRSHYGAIAVYRTSQDRLYPDSSPATSDELLDAIVYSEDMNGVEELTRILTPDSDPIHASSLHVSHTSMSRCLSGNLKTNSPFAITSSTPKNVNDCPTFDNDIFINEINVEQPGQRSREFIELSDGGRGNTPLIYTCLVLFNGHNDDKSYATFDLNGLTTNDQGFLLIGSDKIRSGGADIAISVNRAGLLQNGPDAISLYRAPSGAFPHDTMATSNGLIDAIVYNTGDGLSHSLLDKLLPGKSMVLEDPSHLSQDESISRCHSNHRLDPAVYSLSKPTPGRRNDCSQIPLGREQLPTLYINELRVDIAGQDFIELYNGGHGSSPLDGLILVFFNGANQDKSYLEIDLDGARTNSSGHIVIGNKDVSPVPDIIISDNIHDGPDAVAIYYSKLLDFPPGTSVSSQNIIDVLVYGGEDSKADSLLQSLAPGQAMAKLTPGLSLSRCMMGHPVTMSAFHASMATPGTSNDCSQAPFLLNEVGLGVKRSPGFRGQYIELYDGGRGKTPLTNYILVLFSESSQTGYNVLSFDGFSTNSEGLFLIGNPDTPAALHDHYNMPPSFLQDGPGAIALYRSVNSNDYHPGMAPTQANLVDVIVFGTVSSNASNLLNALLPGQQQVNVEDELSPSWSICRCVCCQTRSNSAFKIAHPTPLLHNNCSVELVSDKLQIIISEINPRNRGHDVEYIELKGRPDTSLNYHILVLFVESGQSSYAVNLSGKRTDHNGIAVIGSQGMTPLPTVSFASSNVPITPPGVGAVALYQGLVTDFPVGTQITQLNLVDAVVYSNDYTKLDNHMTQVLTPGSHSFYAGNFGFTTQDKSISRCQCCQTKTNSMFTLSTPTPYQSNKCPSDQYNATIQMRLLNADYHIWLENPSFVTELRRQVVAGINLYCKCGFNAGYIKDDKILNGSVIFQTTMMAQNLNQFQLLVNSYQKYIQETTKVKVHGTVYIVDSECTSDCLHGSTKPQTSERKGQSPAEEEAIAILCFISLATILSAVFIFVRYRDKIWAYLKRTHNASENCEFPVIFRRWTKDAPSDESNKPVDSFANPVYLYQGANQSTSPRYVIKEQNAVRTECPRNMVQEYDTQELNGTHVKERHRVDYKRAFENPVYGFPPSPVETTNVNSNDGEKGEFGEKKTIINGSHSNNKDISVRPKERMIPIKKSKKPKRPESFANPLYGSNAGPAQLDIIVTQHENGAAANAENLSSHKHEDITAKNPKKYKGFTNPLYGSNAGPAQLGVIATQHDISAATNAGNQQSEVQNSADITEIRSTGKKEEGIKDKILRRLRRGHEGGAQSFIEAPPHFLHM